jgi:hypothetical protein
MASIAESFRSTCGSERGAPQCTTQRRPAATPHVGHGTDDNCFVVSSFFPVENCPMTPYRKTIPFGTLLGTSRSPGESQLLLLINALPESSRVHSGCIVGHRSNRPKRCSKPSSATSMGLRSRTSNRADRAHLPQPSAAHRRSTRVEPHRRTRSDGARQLIFCVPL